MRELKDRMYKMGKQLYDHERQLNEIRDTKLSNSSISGNSTDMSASLQIGDASKMIRQ
jgi:hypothetical protein